MELYKITSDCHEDTYVVADNIKDALDKWENQSVLISNVKNNITFLFKDITSIEKITNSYGVSLIS